jgi:hypothetical protein
MDTNTEEEWFNVNKNIETQTQRIIPSQIELLDLKIIEIFNEINEERIKENEERIKENEERLQNFEKLVLKIETLSKKVDYLMKKINESNNWFNF